MPKLPEFDAGPGKLQPNSQAENAALLRARRVAQTADALGRAFGGVADLAEQHQEHQELTNGAKLTSQFEVDEEIRHREFDWSQPDAANKYLEGFHERVAKLGEELNAKTPGGKEYFARWAGDATVAFGRQALGSMGDAEGIQSYQDSRETVANRRTLAGLSFDRLDESIAGVKGEYTPDKKPPAMDEAHWKDFIDSHERPDLSSTVLTAYDGLTQRAEKEFSENGKTSPAYDRATAEIAARHGFEYLEGTEGSRLQKDLEDAKARGLEQYKVNQGSQKAQTEETTKAEIGRIRISLLPDANGQPPDPKAAANALARLHQLAKSSDPVVAATAGAEAESIGNVIKTQAEDRLTGKYVPDDPSAITEINQRLAAGSLAKVNLDDLRIAHRIGDKTYDEQAKRLDDINSNPALRENEAKLNSWMRTTVAPILDAGATTDFDPNNPTATIDLTAGGVDPKGKAAFGLALNQVTAEYEYLTRQQGMSPEQAYAKVTDPEAIQRAMPTWNSYKANGFEWASQHPATYGIMTGQKAAPPVAQAAPAAAPADPRSTKVQAAGPIRPGESWTAYKARAGIQ